MTQDCKHNTAMVIRRGDGYTHMLCTWRCKQPYVMACGVDGRYTEQPNTVTFFVERENGVSHDIPTTNP